VKWGWTGPSVFDDARAPVRLSARAAFAIVCAAVGMWIAKAITGVVGGAFFFAVFPFVMVVALVAGTVAGLFMVAVISAAFAWAFMYPTGSFAVAARSDVIRLVGFTISAGLVAILAGALRAAYRRARRLRQRAETSAAALHELQEAREDLFRALSHDMRTPLSTVQNQAELLLRAKEAAPADLARRAQSIRTSARRIAVMLDDLVETFRLESGQLVLKRTRVDLATFMAELKARLEGTLPVERLSVAVPQGARVVDADPDRLERILVNLLSNAFKYSPPDAPVVVGSESGNGSVVLSVTDRGPGIEPEEARRIFERFYRGPSSRQADGLGLGLYITRRLVEAHGGRVWVDSSPGGSTFHVALPAGAAAAPSAPSVA